MSGRHHTHRFAAPRFATGKGGAVYSGLPAWLPAAKVAVVLGMLLMLAGWASPARAQEEGKLLALDCWIFEEGDKFKTHHIRCIRDRSHFPVEENSAAPPNVVAYERLHQLLHQGSTEALDRYVRENISVLSNGDMRTIRIFTYPAPWSWNEEFPQKLVRAVLCPKGQSCPVFIRRD